MKKTLRSPSAKLELASSVALKSALLSAYSVTFSFAMTVAVRGAPISVNSVVLPEPEGPVMITISPGANSSSMSNNTCLLESPSPKEWFKCRIRTAEGGAPGLSMPDKNPVPAIVFIDLKLGNRSRCGTSGLRAFMAAALYNACVKHLLNSSAKIFRHWSPERRFSGERKGCVYVESDAKSYRPSCLRRCDRRIRRRRRHGGLGAGSGGLEGRHARRRAVAQAHERRRF